ncbi:MAG: hypothetical protein ACW98K_18165 [Candidatus Kariarchaeaceae archaeon]|jgi:Arc/MetJ-type ribon-helix-helix transcriptional regulator
MSEKTYEKATVNLPIVDLGKIDYLVEQGHYNSRAEFIRIAIKGEVTKHKHSFEVIERDEGTKIKTKFVGLGVMSISRKYLERKRDENIKVNVFVIGMCKIANDVTVDLVEETINQFRVYGKKKGPKDVLEYLYNNRWNNINISIE